MHTVTHTQRSATAQGLHAERCLSHEQVIIGSEELKDMASLSLPSYDAKDGSASATEGE